MRIALIGADGQLGTDLAAAFAGEDVRPLLYPAFDVTRPAEAREALLAIGPDLILNTAAFHRVDECESRPAEAFAVNAVAVRDLARSARELGAVLVHFSTDYVFDGNRREPYDEDDCPGPLSVYAASKRAGEELLAATWERSCVVRTCGLFGRAGSREKGPNFVETMIRKASRGETARVVDDQTVAPTASRELAARVALLVRTGRYGLYHMTSRGSCTWCAFAREIFGLLGLEADLRPVSSREFNAPARRPAYSVLAHRRMLEAGLPDFPDWRTSLRDYLIETGRTVCDR